MRASVPFAVIATLLAAVPAAGGEVISLEEWLALTSGKTVHYAVNGEESGREYYPDGGRFAVFEAPNGDCVEGPWAHTDGRFCFWYGEHFQCFIHMRLDGVLISRPDTGGADQIITEIADDEPLVCVPG